MGSFMKSIVKLVILFLIAAAIIVLGCVGIPELFGYRGKKTGLPDGPS